MNRLSPNRLPAFYEHDDVPFLVYINSDGKPEAVSDLGVISTTLPEVVFEGELIDEARFTELAEERNRKLNTDEKYKEVLAFINQKSDIA